MTPMGNIVVLWGSALLLANILFDPIFQGLISNVKGGSLSSSDINTSPVHLVIFGLITLLVLGFLANTNPKAAKAILAALAGLTILWLISYNQEKQAGTAGTPFAASSTAPAQTSTAQQPTSANAATGPTTTPTKTTKVGNSGSKGGYSQVIIGGQSYLRSPNGSLTKSLTPAES